MSNLRGLQQGRIQSEKMATIGQLSAGIAHEINNPLCFIMSNMNTLNKRMTLISELLAMYENLMAEVQKSNAGRYQAKLESITQFYQEKKIPAMIPDLQEIINESNNGLERIKHIVAHLGSFTAQSQDKMVSLDINASIESAIDMAWNQLKYKCTITKNFSELPLIAGNLEQLKMIFIAILLNAVQAVKEHGEISITTKKSDANIEVTITDNGCGIDPADLRKIFTPFFTTKPVGAGIGLGLSTVYAIVKAHGGSITVESELNKGSTFKIIFPVQKDS
jgi:signal transduction histidine kinase